MQSSFDSSSIDFKSVALKIWAYRYFFVISAFLGLLVAYYLNKTTLKTYENSCTIYITDENKMNLAGKAGILSSMATGRVTDNLENELGILSSYTIINKTLEELSFEISYYIEQDALSIPIISSISKKLQIEIYDQTPIKVVLDRSHPQTIGVSYYVEVLSKDEFHLKVVCEDIEKAYLYNYIDNQIVGGVPQFTFEKTYKFNEEVETDYFKFVVQLENNDNPTYYKGKNLNFSLQNMDFQTIEYMFTVKLSQTTPTSSLINVSFQGQNKQKVTDFLNKLTSVYIARDLQNKNRQAYNTIGFIEEQISDIADSLNYAENDLEKFRSSNQIVDLNFQGQKVIEQMNALDAEKSMLLLQVRYYKYLKNYLRTNADISDLVAPASMNVSDVNLNAIISELTALNSEKMNRLSQNPKDLHVKTIDKKINNIRQTLQEIVENNLKTVDISINEIEYRIKKLQAQLTKLPVTELKLLGIERNFKLNDAIYTFLLQKRAEAQIAQASNTSSYEVVDIARNVLAKVVGPRTGLNYFIGLVLGFIIPFIVVMMKDLFNNKIVEMSALERLTNIPVLGQVYRSSKKIQAHGLANISDNITRESIKSLRTNIQILNAQDIPNQVILISSSVSNEGKTMLAINLAMSFAMAKKKTILVGYDLRNPSFDEQLKLIKDFGISTFLSGVDSAADIIQHTENKYLDVITEGPKSPNPLELIASGKSKDLIELLRNYYEYILIDTSPIGLVTDAKLLMNLTDVNILVVRQSFTKISDFVGNLKNLTNYKLSNLWLVFNDYAMKMDKSGANYKYYAMGTQDSRKGLRYFLFGWIKKLFSEQ